MTADCTDAPALAKALRVTSTGRKAWRSDVARQEVELERPLLSPLSRVGDYDAPEHHTHSLYLFAFFDLSISANPCPSFLRVSSGSDVLLTQSTTKILRNALRYA